MDIVQLRIRGRMGKRSDIDPCAVGWQQDQTQIEMYEDYD